MQLLHLQQTFSKEVLPLDSIMRLINATSRYFKLYRSELLEGEGITGRQHHYIMRICEAPGITQDQLAERLSVDKSNVTRQLAQLEQGGFITRVTPENDRRLLQVYPTQRALDLYPKIQEIHRNWNDRLLEGFSEEERSSLLEMMQRIKDRAICLQEEEHRARPRPGKGDPPCA